LNFFNSFNAFFQVKEETVIHLLQPKSKQFLDQICNNFLKPDVTDLLHIKFENVEYHKSVDSIHLGSECEEYIINLKEDHIDEIKIIRKNCLQFYITAAEEIRKRLPVNDIFLSKLLVFQPRSIFDIPMDTSLNDISFIADTISGFDKNGLRKEWLLLHSNLSVTEKINLSNQNFDEMWIEILQYRDANNSIKFPNLKCLLNAIRSLPHSNADPERVFSILTDTKTKKRNSLSSSAVNSICVLKSAFKTRRENALTMKINEQHLNLMSTKMYFKTCKRKKSSLQLYAADNDIASPSSSTSAI
jgi:hypothetical protein